ncbi:MAG: bifunctional (p)ppGpp synthetase/guanosine-3',5'-bis(diphosphate) 3'-pyrophosphohydrolase [Chitinophagales bacterium]|nr:bifunctional (p)ppGpp synthetase/guanosine-3',5'-bis(diphosphate) 3'-pyrophosphohydrolase [Chitinophagales bacterium]
MPETRDITLTEAEKKEILKEYRLLIKNASPHLKKGDKERVRRAFEMAIEAHAGMRRKSGEPYIYHPIAVARIVSEEIGLAATSIICALLHDTVEDTELTLEDIEQAFDKDTAKIVDGLTKISGVFDVNTSGQAENFRKLLLTLTDDIRVVMVKLADRLHNMRTLGSMPKEKQLKIASETEYLYAPIAHRMGLYAVKTELEDLAMKYRVPDVYKMIATKLNETKRSRARYINNFIGPLKDLLDKTGLKLEIYGRPKSIHSIWRKMEKQKVNFEQVYDLFAIRIIIDSDEKHEKSDCWNVYSIITDLYRPNPNRLRDWISNPKSNGYEALHTTVIGPNGKWVEVQIRSKRMHEIAEKGVAAHWKYKEGGVQVDDGIDQWLASIQSLLNDKEQNALEMVNNVKMNLFSAEIFVFTPKGDLKRLKRGSTALDFAYDVHSAIGNACIGAKVNQRLVPLSYELKTGDQIEILTSKKQKPSEDWLSFVATGKAKNAIRKAVNEEIRRVAEDGKQILERKLKQLKINNTEDNYWTLTNYFKYNSPIDFFVAVSRNKIRIGDFKNLEVAHGVVKLPKPKIEPKKEKFEEAVTRTLSKNAELTIMGQSSDDLEYSFAKCCSPIPGDEVFGFITINDGIKIHRTNCPNAVQLMSKYSYRIVKTKWNTEREVAYLTGLKLHGIDSMGIISQVSKIITNNMHINMKSISFESKDGIYEGTIMLYVTDSEQLDNVIAQMKAIEGLVSVSRFEIEEDM